MSGPSSTTADDQKVIATVNQLLNTALARGSSSIHLEPRQSHTVIRFRTDGMLADGPKLAQVHHPLLVEHLKQRIAEADGSFNHSHENNRAAIRVSTMPMMHGEKVVLHIIPEISQPDSLTSLGYWGPGLAALEHVLSEPHGVIIATSLERHVAGRTILAIAGLLHSVQRSVTVIDDAMPQTIEGINHIDTNQRRIQFERLQLALRQDSDIIAVGNLTDRLTTELTFEASLSRHLLLGSLYAASATTAVRRLLDMTVEPHVIAAGLRAVTGQQLTRQLCQGCREHYQPSDTELKRLARYTGLSTEVMIETIHNLERVAQQSGLGNDLPDLSSTATRITRLFKASKLGCDHCHFTGFQGRIAINEVLVISPAVQRGIILNVSQPELLDIAKDGLAISSQVDHVIKALRGLCELAVTAKRR